MDQLTPLVPEMKSSFVISMDSWLLDLRFVWRADKQLAERFRSYLDVPAVAGSSELYYTFLANCMAANVTHRIIPLRTSSSNGALPHTRQPTAFLFDPLLLLFVAKSPPLKTLLFLV